MEFGYLHYLIVRSHSCMRDQIRLNRLDLTSTDTGPSTSNKFLHLRRFHPLNDNRMDLMKSPEGTILNIFANTPLALADMTKRAN